jgi:hypothetical protein
VALQYYLINQKNNLPVRIFFILEMRGLVNNKIPAYPNAVDVTQKIQAQ